MYKYENLKERILTDEGQKDFLKVRDRVQHLLKEAGVVRMQEASSEVSGDSWLKFAYVDRMVELGEIREVLQKNPPGQYRIFVSTKID